MQRIALNGSAELSFDLTGRFLFMNEDDTPILPVIDDIVEPPINVVGVWLDPVKGSNRTGDGSYGRPYGSLSTFVNTIGLLERKSETGAIIVSGTVKGGDTLLLKGGHHGDVTIDKAFFDNELVISAAPDTKPSIGAFKLRAGKNITLKGIIIDSSLGHERLPVTPIIRIGTDLNETLKTSLIKIEDSLITSGSGYINWDVSDWTMYSKGGVRVGKNTIDVTIKNCEFVATKIAIDLQGNNGVVEGCVIDHWMQCGVQVGGDFCTLKNNVILHNVPDDFNHDVGVKLFNIKGNTGAVINANVCLEEPSIATMSESYTKGFVGFDGPYVDCVFTNNFYKGSGVHGVSLYDLSLIHI